MREFEVKILNLSRLDLEALKSMAPTERMVVEEPSSDARRINELLTLAVIGGIGLVSTAAGYYFGKRHSERIEIDIEVRDKDGASKKIRLRLDRSSTEPVNNQILSQIQTALGN